MVSTEKFDETKVNDVMALANRFDFAKNPTQVLELGAANKDQLAQISNEVLMHVKKDDLGIMGDLMGDITNKIKSVDFNPLKERKQLPIIGGFLKKIMNTKESFITRYQTIEAQINANIAQIEIAQKSLLVNNSTLETIKQHTIKEYQDLGVAIIAGKLNKERLENEIETLVASNTEYDKQQVFSHRQTLERLEKRITDLSLLQTSAIQTLPMIAVLFNSNLNLIEKFQTIGGLTIPAWQRQILMTVNILDQKRNSDIIKSIDDTTNELLEKNMETFKDTSIAIAKSNQRNVIDIETLEKVQADLLETMSEVVRINKQAETDRQSTYERVKKLNIELQDKLGEKS